MATNRAADLADEIIDEIFSKTKDLNDSDYVDCLKQISGALDDASSVKRQEMDKASEGD